jgi:hypothetical protein
MLNENRRLRELIQSSEIESSGSGVNSGSGTPSGNTRSKRLAKSTASGSIGAASPPSQPAFRRQGRQSREGARLLAEQRHGALNRLDDFGGGFTDGISFRRNSSVATCQRFHRHEA